MDRVVALPLVEIPVELVGAVIRAVQSALRGLSASPPVDWSERISSVIVDLDALRLDLPHGEATPTCWECCEEVCPSVAHLTEIIEAMRRGRDRLAALQIEPIAEALRPHDPELVERLERAYREAEGRLDALVVQLDERRDSLRVASAVAVTQRQWAPVLERLAVR
jgi:hypothetical protein